MVKKKKMVQEIKINLQDKELNSVAEKVCKEFIQSINDKSLEQKYVIVSLLYFSFLQVCAEEGVLFKEIGDGDE
jgi:hypothetical protein